VRVPSTKKNREKAYSGDVHKLVKAEVGESIEAEGLGIRVILHPLFV
jgi:hypothetical protein